MFAKCAGSSQKPLPASRWPGSHDATCLHSRLCVMIALQPVLKTYSVAAKVHEAGPPRAQVLKILCLAHSTRMWILKTDRCRAHHGTRWHGAGDWRLRIDRSSRPEVLSSGFAWKYRFHVQGCAGCSLRHLFMTGGVPDLLTGTAAC